MFHFFLLGASIAADYDLIDTWNLGKRYVEAISLNKSEMDMYLQSCRSVINMLQQDINERSIECTSFTKCCDILQKTEIFRLENVIRAAAEQFEKCDDVDNCDDDALDDAEAGEYEDLILDAVEVDLFDSDSSSCNESSVDYSDTEFD